MIKCPYCHFENEDGALFCEQCKSDLTGVPETPATPMMPTPPPIPTPMAPPPIPMSVDPIPVAASSAAFADPLPLPPIGDPIPFASPEPIAVPVEVEAVPIEAVAVEAVPVEAVAVEAVEVVAVEPVAAVPVIPEVVPEEVPIAAQPYEEPVAAMPVEAPVSVVPAPVEPIPVAAVEAAPPTSAPAPVVPTPAPTPEPVSAAAPIAPPPPAPEPAPAPAPTPAAVPTPAATNAIPANAEPRLVVMRGQKRNAEYPIYPGFNFIGRADEKPVDIDLEDQEPPERVWCSRQHALITFENDQLLLEDLNSANGTFLNREKVYPGKKLPLAINDVIQIGSVQLKVVV